MSEAVLENPVIKDDFGASLREAAQKYDNGEITADDSLDLGIKPEAEVPEPKVEQPKEPVATDKPRDEKGKFVKAGDKPAEPVTPEAQPEQVEPQPTVSEYEQKKAEKAAKEKERQDRSWESVNRRKEELEAKERAIALREQELANKTQQTQQPKRVFLSSQLMAAYEDLDREADKALQDGDFDRFNERRALSKKALAEANRAYTQEKQEQEKAQLEQHNRDWETQRQKVYEQFPDAKDGNTELGKQMQSIWETHGKYLSIIPNGFETLREVAQLRIEAGKNQQLQSDLSKAQEEIKRLNGSLSLNGDGVTSPARQKNFNDLSTEQQGAMLRSAALEHDAFV